MFISNYDILKQKDGVNQLTTLNRETEKICEEVGHFTAERLISKKVHEMIKKEFEKRA